MTTYYWSIISTDYLCILWYSVFHYRSDHPNDSLEWSITITNRTNLFTSGTPRLAWVACHGDAVVRRRRSWTRQGTCVCISRLPHGRKERRSRPRRKPARWWRWHRHDRQQAVFLLDRGPRDLHLSKSFRQRDHDDHSASQESGLSIITVAKNIFISENLFSYN